MTSHFEESIITGTRLMSGSAAMSLKKVGHRLFGVEHPLVHVHVDELGAVFHLLAGDFERLLVVSLADEPGENAPSPPRWCARPRSRTPVSGPMFNGSRPLRRQRGGISGMRRGAKPSTASLIARMCAGVVPQQPPTQVQKAALREFGEHLGHVGGGGVVVFAEFSLGRPALG